MGKGLVEDKFAIAVALEIKGGQRHQGVPSPQTQMTGLPSLAWHNAAAGLQGMEPGPGVKGQGILMGWSSVLQQRLKLIRGDFSGGPMPAGLQVGHP